MGRDLDLARQMLEQSADAIRGSLVLADAVVVVAEGIADRFARGGKLLVCGNGGSAADAQHFAAETRAELGEDAGLYGAAALALRGPPPDVTFVAMK